MSPDDDSDENRTRVTAVKGRCLDRLTTEPSAWRSSFDRLAMGFTHVLSDVFHELRTSVEPSLSTIIQSMFGAIAPPVGLEPTTLRLTAECSTD